MAGEGCFAGWNHVSHHIRLRPGCRRIHEENPVIFHNRVRIFDMQLVVRLDRHSGPCQPGDLISGRRPQTVVLPARVAIATEDEIRQGTTP
jgi:hypothetical protein